MYVCYCPRMYVTVTVPVCMLLDPYARHYCPLNSDRGRLGMLLYREYWYRPLQYFTATDPVSLFARIDSYITFQTKNSK